MGGVFLEKILTFMEEMEERWQMEGSILIVCFMSGMHFIEMFSRSSSQHSVTRDSPSKDALHCG